MGTKEYWNERKDKRELMRGTVPSHISLIVGLGGKENESSTCFVQMHGLLSLIKAHAYASLIIECVQSK